jgi:hypothetical protein
MMLAMILQGDFMAYTCPLCGDKNAYCGAWEVKCHSHGCKNYEAIPVNIQIAEIKSSTAQLLKKSQQKIGSMDWTIPSCPLISFCCIDGKSTFKGGSGSGWRWKNYWEFFEREGCTHMELINNQGPPAPPGIYTLDEMKRLLIAAFFWH